MQEIRLDMLLGTRPSLRPGEVVTIVVSVAGDLASMHAAGRAHGAVSAAAIALGATGRPRLHQPAAVAADATTDSDVRALARLGGELVGPYPPQRLVWALHEAAQGGVNATALAAKVLGACRPEPVRRGTAAPSDLAALPPGAPMPGVGRAEIVREPGAGRLAGVLRAGADRLRGRGRLLALVLVPVLAVVAFAFWTNTARTGAEPPATRRPASASASSAAASPAAVSSWQPLLERLDRRRAAAYAGADTAALRRVYMPGSAALTTDLATLRAYAREGLRVRGLRLRVGALHELSRSGSAAVLVVTDRLDGYQLVDAAGHVTSRERGRGDTTWRVTLHRWHGGWRIASISHGV